MTSRIGYDPYEPQLIPLAQGDNIWIIEGPEVQYRLGGALIPCPTRMTVVKFGDGTLWLHSPVEHSAELQQKIAALGLVSALVAPNSYHFLQVDNWASANPDATIYATNDIANTIAVSSVPLNSGLVANWSKDIDHLSIELGRFSETVFFHWASKSLVVTDLMQTFEASRIRSLFTRLLLQVGGATGPNAKPSIEIRRAARKHREALRAGVKQMIEWNPRQIILAHGPCIRHDPIDAIRLAFRWLE